MLQNYLTSGFEIDDFSTESSHTVFLLHASIDIILQESLNVILWVYATDHFSAASGSKILLKSCILCRNQWFS